MTYLLPPKGKSRKPRKDNQFAREASTYQPFKDLYKAENTRPGRGQLFRNKIAPAVANFWHESGTGPQTPDAVQCRLEELQKHLRNLWRSPFKADGTKKGRGMGRNDWVWRLHKDEKVLPLIAKALGLPSVDPGTQGVFGKRTKYCAYVYEKDLTEEERNEVDARTADGKNTPNPPDVQLKLAEKHADARFDKWAKERWLEMGVMQVGLHAYVGRSGKVEVSINDNIAGNLGSPKRNFCESNPQLVEMIGKKLIDYILSLKEDEDTAFTQPDPRPDLEIRMNEAGIPIVPPLPAAGVTQTKDEKEKYFRRFLNLHYAAATGRLAKAAPGTAMEANLAAFIDPQYYPTGWKYQDVRAMHKKPIDDFFNHLRARQSVHPDPADVFRFKAYTGKGPDGRPKMFPAQYDRRMDLEAAAARADRARAKRKAATARRLEQARAATLEGLTAFDAEDEHIGHAYDAANGTSNVAHSTNWDAANIDPQLRAPNVIVAAAAPLPVAHSNEGAGLALPPGMVCINAQQMDMVINMGFEPQIPQNGPGGGFPEFIVPRETLTAAQTERQRQEKQGTSDESRAPAAPEVRPMTSKNRPKPRPIHARKDAPPPLEGDGTQHIPITRPRQGADKAAAAIEPAGKAPRTTRATGKAGTGSKRKADENMPDEPTAKRTRAQQARKALPATQPAAVKKSRRR